MPLIKTPPKKNETVKKTTFEYEAPAAQKVYVSGTFNDWSFEETPLKKISTGKWKLEVTLPPGRYEYRYLVDGNWQCDQRPVQCIPNVFGTWNCVVEVL